MSTFAGFPKETLGFLTELEANNNRDWFADNKQRYDTEVLEPAFEFINAMGTALQKISPCFDAVAKRSGGSLMRVYRDTRFSKDKTPYKTNVGIQFRHERGKDVHAPGYYVHLDRNECFLGIGMWHPEPVALAAIRTRIVEQPKLWHAAISRKPFRDALELGGSSLKRPPRGYDAGLPHIEDIKRKDFIAVASFGPEFAESSTLVKDLGALMKKGTPLMKFLCDAVGVEF